MVKNILLSLCLVGLLASCAQAPVKTVYQDKDIPIPYVPAPPVVVRPVLAVQVATDAQKADLGQMATVYALSLAQLKGYTCNLETIVAKYQELSQQNPSLLVTTAVVPAAGVFSQFASMVQLKLAPTPTTPATSTLIVDQSACSVDTTPVVLPNAQGLSRPVTHKKKKKAAH